MRPGAPVLHDYAPDNITKHIPIRVGDVEQGFAESDLIVEETYSTQQVEHAYLEPEAGLAYVDHDGVVTIVSPSQNITHHRHMLARIIAKPINKVRFIMSPVGGGFGGKEDMIYQGMLALMAMKTRRPVRLVFTREESIISTAKRHPSRTTYKMGLTRDGRIRAVEIKMICDGGAYGLSTEGVMRKAAILAAGPYAIPNVKVDTYGVYTNNTPSGAFRSFGALQAQFATETHLDICAEKLGLDPFEIRRINAMRDGAMTHTKQTLNSVSYAARARRRRAGVALGDGRADLARRHARRSRRRGHARALRARRALRGQPRNAAERGRLMAKKRGRGVAGCWYGIARTATVDRAGAWAEIDDGGTAKIVTGVTEIGEGILTVLAQIAARRTRRAPAGRHHRRQRHRPLAGSRACRRHAPDLHDRQFVALACRAGARHARRGAWRSIGASTAACIRTAAGEIWAEGTNHRMPMERGGRTLQAARRGAGRLRLVRHRHHRPRSGRWLGPALAGLCVRLPGRRGRGRYADRRGAGARHLGRARRRPRGQSARRRGPDRGRHRAGARPGPDGGLQARSTATPRRPIFAKYILPTSLDVPHVTSVIVEDPDPIGPLGVKGIGEPAMIPTIPAIMNAIYDAVGVRITALPATPEKVLEAIKAKERAASQRDGGRMSDSCG